jgi:hypothetical protein
MEPPYKKEAIHVSDRSRSFQQLSRQVFASLPRRVDLSSPVLYTAKPTKHYPSYDSLHVKGIVRGLGPGLAV